MRTWHSIVLAVIIFFSLSEAQADEFERDFQQHRTPTYTEHGDESCLRCHSSDKMRAIGKGHHSLAEDPRSPAAVHACESCHGKGSIHISRAHGGRGFPPLTEFGRGKNKAPREEQIGACMSCHNNPDSGLEAIAFSGTVHDRKAINCSSCHKTHAAVDPMSDREQQSATCFRCHRKVKKEHPKVRNREVRFDRISCSACHKIHKLKAEEQ